MYLNPAKYCRCLVLDSQRKSSMLQTNLVSHNVESIPFCEAFRSNVVRRLP